ncbi:MAG: PEP/pyruvate-binding domain-containing protein [Desulfonatronovibrio sp.]
MNGYFTALKDIEHHQTHKFGNKTCSLALLQKHGMRVPDAYGLSTDVFLAFLKNAGLGEIIDSMLKSESLEKMRWEAIWDLSLRIRNQFVKASLPERLENLGQEAVAMLPNAPFLAVRSSAPGEDSGATSFAGLHESEVPVKGASEVLDAIVRVWSSLWSDRALLYRRELGLDPSISSMSVLVQECIQGEYSGVAFSIDPTDETRAVIECVPGLNTALVDGSVPPARWILDRRTGKVISHDCGPWEPGRDSLPGPAELQRVWDLAMKCEECFGKPQDVEWTMKDGKLYCLQSRPVTTAAEHHDSAGQVDKRPWYLSLHSSFESLQSLRREIEEELLPALEKQSRDMSAVKPGSLDDDALIDEIVFRHLSFRKWREIYYSSFIPMAHGVRLLGMVYNDALRPSDPFAFTGLLRGGDLEAMRRNQDLQDLAAEVRRHPEIAGALERGDTFDRDKPGSRFFEMLEIFTRENGSLLCSSAWCTEGQHALLSLILEMARQPSGQVSELVQESSEAEKEFLQAFAPHRRDFARQVLELGRAAHRIRDNDNLAIGRLQVELIRAVDEGRIRLVSRDVAGIRSAIDDIPGEYLDITSPAGKSSYNSEPSLNSQQGIFKGHPAGPGVARGLARVIHEPGDLFQFRSGEVLVCTAMDPGMSFVVPMASAIVEARGGMLVHGAIIAREYGVPCVTGLNSSLELINTGDMLLVDGYKGIVTLQNEYAL